MKKTVLIALGAVFLLGSCEQVQSLTQAPSTVVAPKFTTIDKLLQLTPGMSFSEVVNALGCEPYDVYTINNETEKTVLIWHYKKIQRSEKPATLETRPGATSGTEVICCLELVYVTFENQKFVHLITDAAKQKAAVAKTSGENSSSQNGAQRPSFFKFR